MKTLITSVFALSCFAFAACGGDATGSPGGAGDEVNQGQGARAGSGGSGQPPGGAAGAGVGTGGAAAQPGVGGSGEVDAGQGGRVIIPGTEDTTDAILQPVDAPYLPGSGSGGTGSGNEGGSGWGDGGTGSGGGGGRGPDDPTSLRLVWGNDHRSCEERWVSGCGAAFAIASATTVLERGSLYQGARFNLAETDGFISISGPDRGDGDCWGGGGTLRGELEVLFVDLTTEAPLMVYQVTGSGDREASVDGVFTAYWCD